MWVITFSTHYPLFWNHRPPSIILIFKHTFTDNTNYYTSDSKSTSSSSRSTWRSSSSSGWLEQVVRWQKSEHFNHYECSHVNHHYRPSCTYMTQAGSITGLGATSPLIQSITDLSWALSFMRDQPWPTGDGTSLFRKEIFHVAAWKLACRQCLYKLSWHGGSWLDSVSAFFAQNTAYLYWFTLEIPSLRHRFHRQMPLTASEDLQEAAPPTL